MVSFEHTACNCASKVVLIIIFIFIAGCIRPVVKVSEGPIPYQQSVTITPTATTMPPVSNKPGTISITTSPDNAQIFVNGAYRGHSPLTIEQLSPGTKVIQIKLTAYHFEWVTIELKSGETFYLSKQLIRYPRRDEQ